MSVGGRRRVLRLRGLRTGAVVREAQREQVRDAGQLIPTGWVVRVVAGTRGRARRASLPPVGDVSYGIVVVAVVLGRIVRSVGADGLSEPSVPVVGEVHRLGAAGPASSSEHVVDDAGDFRRLVVAVVLLHPAVVRCRARPAVVDFDLGDSVTQVVRIGLLDRCIVRTLPIVNVPQPAERVVAQDGVLGIRGGGAQVHFNWPSERVVDVGGMQGVQPPGVLNIRKLAGAVVLVRKRADDGPAGGHVQLLRLEPVQAVVGPGDFRRTIVDGHEVVVDGIVAV